MYKKIICFVLLIFFVSVCMSADTPNQSGNEENIRKILIVSDGSRFKVKVVEQLFEYSSSQSLDFTVVDVENALNINLAEYERYIFLCKMKGGKVDEDTYNFYQTITDKNKILIGLTHFFNMPMPELAKQNTAGIDVVTSASKNRNVNHFSKEIFDWINAGN